MCSCTGLFVQSFVWLSVKRCLFIWKRALFSKESFAENRSSHSPDIHSTHSLDRPPPDSLAIVSRSPWPARELSTWFALYGELCNLRISAIRALTRWKSKVCLLCAKSIFVKEETTRKIQIPAFFISLLFIQLWVAFRMWTSYGVRVHWIHWTFDCMTGQRWVGHWAGLLWFSTFLKFCFLMNFLDLPGWF